ncbi:uncharacterized protein LOC116841510 isoform X3 [Odontomachus brunneus]|uniref:uncharacterized protein LOC116841510 isoform X3 n=1 Tax=Odontomachus brunneus TaxID=486640 RepID=UPI0013F268B7|nr:uncharacterized protein LOC116841510 isoform X3 [Odontomachus brunneus]
MTIFLFLHGNIAVDSDDISRADNRRYISECVALSPLLSRSPHQAEWNGAKRREAIVWNRHTGRQAGRQADSRHSTPDPTFSVHFHV